MQPIPQRAPIFLAILAASCGAPAKDPATLPAPRYVDTAPTAGGTTTATTGGGGAMTTAATTVPCGPDARALDRQACTPGADACRPAGWTCECAARQRVNCGGAQMAPMLMPPTWACSPIVATADRGDGCPFAAPGDRATCEHEGATCNYDLDPDCHRQSAIARCAERVWAVEHLVQPPPP